MRCAFATLLPEAGEEIAVISKRLVNGQIDRVIDGPSLFVAAMPTIPTKLAAAMCRDIAAASLDENSQPIGFRHVHVHVGAAEIAADCDVR